MIKLKNTTKIYGNIRALDGVNLEIGSGEMVMLVGASGAGKSTLMKLLYREERPTSGQIIIGNIDVSSLSHSKIPYLRRRMGIVFQDFKLLPGQSAYDNVAYVLRALGVAPNEIKKRVLGALKVVGLIDKVDATPEQLSGGEQQRIGIARAIVNGPAILVADEPTGNLDPQTSAEIMNFLLEINKRGTTVLVCTHDHQLVDQMRQRVITMSQGRVISDVVEGGYRHVL